MAQNRNLSSADLLTLQILQRELVEPSISKDYDRELRARIEYLNNYKDVREKVLVPAPRCYPLSMEIYPRVSLAKDPLINLP